MSKKKNALIKKNSCHYACRYIVINYWGQNHEQEIKKLMFTSQSNALINLHSASLH